MSSRPRPLLRSTVLAASAAVVTGAVTALPAPARAERAPVVLPAWTCTDTETQVLAGATRSILTAQCDMQPLPVDDPPVHWVTHCALSNKVLPPGADFTVFHAAAPAPGAKGAFKVEIASESPLVVGDSSVDASCRSQSEAGDSQEEQIRTFTFHVVDTAPTCEDAVVETGFGVAATVALSCSDTFGVREITSAPQHGTVTGLDGTDGTETTYTPEPGFTGTDTFVVTSTNLAGEDTATVSVTVGAPPVSPDTDGDRLTDAQEEALGTDPRAKDTDGDGLGDGREVRGIRMSAKVAYGIRRAQGRPVGVVRPDPLRADTDGDGLGDGAELRLRRIGQTVLTPLSSYVIGKRVTNPVRADSDRDGLTDREELLGTANRAYGSAPSDPMRADTDMGGIRDGSEVRRGANPVDARGTGNTPARHAG
ncbi:Ig-like domain-containing protein [Nocardioides sp.]|uniref:Ig-like domain-containing protein n=1 Tax=Nocardioides sp. TaxID=35761 RepID=UPI003515B9D5